MTEKIGLPANAECVFQGIIFDVYQREQEMFDGSKKIFEKAKRRNTVDVVAVLENGEIIVLEEEQPGRPPFYGLVGGSGEHGEAPLEIAKRELAEETGLTSDDWELFGTYGFSSKIDGENNIFIARNCKKTEEINIDLDGEKILIKKVKWNEFLDFIAHPKFRVKDFGLKVFKELYLGKEKTLKTQILGK